MDTFGSRIRTLRKLHNWSLRELADMAEINFTYLSKIETDKGLPPSEETIRRIADLLGANGDELVLLADKLPQDMEQDLLARPEMQVAEMYRTLRGKTYSEEDWRDILRMMKERGTDG